MKISQKLYDLMYSAYSYQRKHRTRTEQIEKELEKLGLNSYKMRMDDIPMIDFIDYGMFQTKEQIEERLEDYANAVTDEQEKKE